MHSPLSQIQKQMAIRESYLIFDLPFSFYIDFICKYKHKYSAWQQRTFYKKSYLIYLQEKPRSIAVLDRD